MTRPAPARSRVRIWADLARAGNFPSVASNVLAALVLSQPGDAVWPEGALLAWTLLAGCLAYAGGATLNDVADARFDAVHRPDRSIPSGAITVRGAALLGFAQLFAGSAVLVLFGAGVLWVLLLVAVILAYDAFHKRWTGSVMLMGGCRVALALALASLPGHSFTPWLLGWIALLFLYIVGLSLLARREYAIAAKGTAADRARAERMGRTVGRLLALIPVLDAAALLASGAALPALVCALAYPLGRLAQRVAAST